MIALWRIGGLAFLIGFIHSTTAATFTLTLNTNGNGTVARNPTNQVYPNGAVVTITALPAPGWGFDSWSGDAVGSTNPLNVTMSSNKTITANFSQATLTVNVIGQGSVSPSGGGFSNGAVVQLTATPSNGWYFQRWSGDVSSFSNPLNVVMNSNKTLTATFVDLPVGVMNFNVSTQYSAVTNPVGPWSYGWLPALGTGGFTLLTYKANNTSENGVPTPGWQFSSSQTPAVYKNTGTNTATLNGGQGVAYPGEVFFVPGENGRPENYGVIRFVVPYAGLWQIDTVVASLYNGPVASDTDFHILTNGTEIYGQFLAVVVTNSFSTALNLTAADIIDFMIGRGADGAQPGSVLKIAANLSTTTTNVPPVITQDPQSTNVAVGGTAAFQVAASGVGPLTYQWERFGVPLAGRTTTTLVLDNVQPADFGDYRAVVSNPYGSATSLVAELNVTNACQGTNLVTICNDATLRQAVAIGGTIRFCCSGTIVLTNTLPVTKDTTLDAAGAVVAIDGGDAVRLLDVSTNVHFGLTNLTLVHGRATGLLGGAAILNRGGSVTLIDSRVNQNTARDVAGGAVACHGGSLLVANSEFASNTVSGSIAIPQKSVQGGAIFAQGTLVQITDSLFHANSLTSDSTQIGSESTAQLSGGALSFGPGTIAVATRTRLLTNAVLGGFTGNGLIPGVGGGAIYDRGTSFRAEQCSFLGNRAQGSSGYTIGAGRAVGGAINCVGETHLNGCAIIGNTSRGGDGRSASGYPGSLGAGGAVASDGALFVTNSTFALNSARGGDGGSAGATAGDAAGGAIYSAGGATLLMNVTIASNSVNVPVPFGLSGSGLSMGMGVAAVTNYPITLRNSLLASASNSAWGQILDSGYNICSDGSAAFSSGSSFNFTDPKLLPLTNNGGPTLTMALAEDSPAVDWAPAAGAPTTDQRGVPRPGSGANVVDLGAFEFTPPSPPPLLAIRTGGSVTISFEGTAGKIYRLERCTDFGDWELFLLIGPVAESGLLSGSFPITQPHQFFRLRWGP